MCRLLGTASARPATVQAVLGEGEQQVFADMARLHRDGWGSAWLADDGTVEADRHSSCGVGDPALEDTLNSGGSRGRIVHLRLATGGFACSSENTHPFVADGMAFAHNGSMQPTGPIEQLIGAEQAASIRGETDSERYFAAVRTAIAAGASVQHALVETVATLRAAYPQRSLNALLLASDALYAVHASEGVPIPHHIFAASGLDAAELPRHHVDAYYLMRMRRTATGVAVASSGLDIAGWDPLPAESVTRVDLATLETVTVPLSTAGALAA